MGTKKKLKSHGSSGDAIPFKSQDLSSLIKAQEHLLLLLRTTFVPIQTLELLRDKFKDLPVPELKAKINWMIDTY